MNDDNLLAAAKKQRDKLRVELDELEQFIALSEKMATKLQLPVSAHRAAPELVAPPPPTVIDVTPTEQVLRAVEEILEHSNRPMRPSELVNELENRGIRVSGKKPNNNLSAMLHNAKGRFQSIGRHGWFLAKHGPLFEQLYGG